MTDVTTIKVQGQTVWFEELTDDQVDDALTHMPPTQQRILGLAGRGLGPGMQEVFIKRDRTRTTTTVIEFN
jgi:hypothetical protein